MNHDERNLHDALARLGDPPPPPGLDARIWTTRRHRLQRSFGLGGIAIVGVLAASTLMLQPHPSTNSRTTTSVATHAASASIRAEDVQANIRVIDTALQTAYSRNANDDEVAPLWKARRELLLRLPQPAPGSGFI